MVRGKGVMASTDGLRKLLKQLQGHSTEPSDFELMPKGEWYKDIKTDRFGEEHGPLRLEENIEVNPNLWDTQTVSLYMETWFGLNPDKYLHYQESRGKDSILMITALRNDDYSFFKKVWRVMVGKLTGFGRKRR